MELSEYLEKRISDYSLPQLKELCDLIRKEIIVDVQTNGGHLSSNLGIVELMVALFYTFDFPKDKIIFDVGHQCYAYKILTGRLEGLKKLRQTDGVSGFPDKDESSYDVFTSGHSGSSMSFGLGLAKARDIQHEDYYIVNLIGDASLINGENLEALSSSSIKPNKYIVILNDNGMGISPNDNGLYKLISKITTTKRYTRGKEIFDKTIGKIFIGKFFRWIKNLIKSLIGGNNIFDKLGFKYVGIFDGNDLKATINMLKKVKETKRPVILHLKTKKGQGFTEAENDSSKYHSIGKEFKVSSNDFSSSLSSILINLKEKYPIHAITAGMMDGTGLRSFSERFPNCIHDVGIAEEFAVTYAAGLAKGGLRPICCIYSTFIQRAIDQIIEDVCLQNLPVVFCLDRAGLVGNDGKTHQGVFDLTFLRSIPGLTVFAPGNIKELKLALGKAMEINGPVAIRYSSGKITEYEIKSEDIFSWDELYKGENTVVYATGNRMVNLGLILAKEKNYTLINARCIKPIDYNILDKYKDQNVIVLEENMESGGLGECISAYLNKKVIKYGVKDTFIDHSSIDEQIKKYIINYND